MLIFKDFTYATENLPIILICIILLVPVYLEILTLKSQDLYLPS